MASMWLKTAGPSHLPPDPIMPFDEDLYSTSEEELTSREANNRRLRQAISYLADEGGADPPASYVNRVQKIYDGIIRQYPEEGYQFDTNLYKQLRSMVREVQNDFQKIVEEESSVELEDSEASIEELFSPEALYRGEEEHDFDPPPSAPARRLAPPRPASAHPIAKAPMERSTVLERQFHYGGPNNEVEEWHRDFPAVCPFGETLYMQEWESMKINYDLAESAKKSASDADSVVTTNVPYDAVRAHFHQNSHYDSGSRFKLPKILDEVLSTASNAVDHSALVKMIDSFNRGGDWNEQEKKDYAPRIFLPQVSIPRKENSTSLPKGLARSSATPNLKITSSRPPKPTVSAGPSTSRRLSKSRRTGTINPEVVPTVAQHPQRAEPDYGHDSPTLDDINDLPSDLFEPTIPTKASPKPRTPTPKAKLKKFHEARATATKSASPVSNTRTRSSTRSHMSSSAPPAPATRATSSRRSTPAARGDATPTTASKPAQTARATTAPVSRRLNHIAVGPSRQSPARPSRTEPRPASPAITRAATRTGKRKLTEADDSYAEATKKARIGKKTGTKKTVAFAEEAPLARESSPSRTVTVKKSADKKPAAKKEEARAKVKKAAKKKAKEARSVPEVYSKATRVVQGSDRVPRGTTRSGMKFKPAGKGEKK